ncbi:MAG: hypothetical protein Q7J75_01920 [Rhodoferax sp.]|nr:hypothetical protein [Rhodoferax sp.]
MCSLSIAPENINAVIAAIAALSGVVISLLGNWFLSWLKEGHERKVLLRSKYEELAFLVVESSLDYQKVVSAEANHQLLRDSQPISSQKAAALAQLYFPDLLPETNVYLLSFVSFRNACAVASAGDPKLPFSQAIASSPSVVAAQEELEAAKSRLHRKLQTCAKNYIL